MPQAMTQFSRPASSSGASSRGSQSNFEVVSLYLIIYCLSSDFQQLSRYLYKKGDAQRWFDHDAEIDSSAGKTYLGVMVKTVGGSCWSEPRNLDSTITEAVEHLRAPFAMTIRSGAVRALLEAVIPTQTKLVLGRVGPTVRIVNTVTQIIKTTADYKYDGFLYLCKQERILLLCSDQGPSLLKRGSDVEDLIVTHLWGAPNSEEESPSFQHSFDAPRRPDIRLSDGRSLSEQLVPYLKRNTLRDSAMMEKLDVIQTAIEKEQQGDKLFDPEKDGQEVPVRRFLLNHALLVGLALVLVVLVEMACIAKMVTEVRLDGNYLRFALLAVIPLFATFSLFFMIVIAGSLWQILGPLSNLSKNSMFYSAIAPKPGRYPDLELPHITIQMPVYKEGLQGVILPTISSVMAAVRHYEKQGGTASIFVNDDGMQLVNKDLAEARKAFYELNNIGWCSRPPHKEKKKAKRGFFGKSSSEAEQQDDSQYFIRKGQFKKASNMNYCLDFSLRVEEEYDELVKKVCDEGNRTEAEITVEEQDELYEQARNRMVERDGGKTWAGGDVRLGSIILIIDSDTRIPEDSLLYGALEMHESPEVALIQHGSGIMQVVHNTFENGITYFTNLVYSSIQFAVGNGDCAPFVGHNTFIRWDALQSIAWYDDEDMVTKFWSDSHVSEDFDVSLRMQMNGFVVRLAVYHDGGFQEGVSLTVYDELARWEKYAYGCNELVFNPLYQWVYRGPFTRLFLRFLSSNIKITSKITIFAYIGTYYAVASAIPLSLVNYIMVGWFNNEIDQFYLTSWKVFVGMAVVFNGLSPLGYAMLRHRMGKATFFVSLWETIKWTPMFLLFFGGISFHLLKAILCHFLSIKMEWTTTAKEFHGGFRVGLDRIVRDFKWMYLILGILIGALVYFACFAPYGWTITDFSAIVPLANQIGCHALLPFALGLF